jgi:Protein of unknown function (DUF501)
LRITQHSGNATVQLSQLLYKVKIVKLALFFVVALSVMVLLDEAAAPPTESTELDESLTHLELSDTDVDVENADHSSADEAFRSEPADAHQPAAPRKKGKRGRKTQRVRAQRLVEGAGIAAAYLAESGPPAGVSEADIVAIATQLGYIPHNLVAVAARGSTGQPAVLLLHPLAAPVCTRRNDVQLQPFPTIYWLCCPQMKCDVSRLEVQGLVQQFEARLQVVCILDFILYTALQHTHEDLSLHVYALSAVKYLAHRYSDCMRLHALLRCVRAMRSMQLSSGSSTALTQTHGGPC